MLADGEEETAEGRSGARPPTPVLVKFISDCKSRFGVEPICRVLTRHGCPIAPSTYYDAVARLMRDLGLAGVRRGRRQRTTRPANGSSLTRPSDR
jgi:hypothetical protein